MLAAGDNVCRLCGVFKVMHGAYMIKIIIKVWGIQLPIRLTPTKYGSQCWAKRRIFEDLILVSL